VSLPTELSTEANYKLVTVWIRNLPRVAFILGKTVVIETRQNERIRFKTHISKPNISMEYHLFIEPLHTFTEVDDIEKKGEKVTD